MSISVEKFPSVIACAALLIEVIGFEISLEPQLHSWRAFLTFFSFCQPQKIFNFS